MKRLGWLLAIAAVLSVPAAAQTVDEIIAKNVAARGGLEKMKAVQSMRINGRFEIGPGMEAPFVLEVKRPEHFRMEFTVQGMTATQAYDGKSGWQIMPFNGNTNAEPLSPEDLKDAQENADIDGPLVDYKAKGHQVELAGKEDVEGAPAYKLKITLKNGDTLYDFIDVDSGLEVRIVTKRTVNGTQREIEQTFGDFKAVEGLMFPFALESGAKDSPQRQKMMVDKVVLNVAVDDSKFAMPTPKPVEPKPADPKPAATKPPMAMAR
jgi:outer membrane lipoprotein-sorting protein